MTENINLYIHFPFCLKKCLYCDFYSERYNPENAGAFLDVLHKEIDHYSLLFSNNKIRTLYIGGGSPNLIDINQFQALHDKLKSAFDLDSLEEFTIEINPARHDSDLFQKLRDYGVNRINVGIQSFHDVELQTLGRIHSVDDSIKTLSLLQKIGFDHIGLDLIYGIPDQTMHSWMDSLNSAIRFPIDHISLYNLSYEENTPLKRMLEDGEIAAIDTELELAMYLEACSLLDKNGFIHYEVSNWAKPGGESRHNRGYWEGKKYLGLGPSAHSFDGRSRWWNVRSTDTFIHMLNAGQLPVMDEEELNDQDLEIEHLFLRLRTSDGLSRGQFENIFHLDFRRIIHKLEKLIIDEEYWIFDGNTFKLTPAGWFVSDSIIYTILSIVEEIRNDHKKN